MTTPTTAVPEPSPSFIERLADELATGWADGRRTSTEEILACHPGIGGRSDVVLELLAEELAVRAEYGEPATSEEMLRRFPDLAGPVQALLDCQRWLGPRPGPAEFPDAGDELGEFRLLSELGRGVVGRVMLAVQPDLADRPVVLKLTPDLGDEHLSLARLQHTHIVPLYSVHEFPDRGLRGLCLPYFGGETLANLARDLRPTERPGRHLVAGLRRCQASAPIPVPVGGPGVEFLKRARPADAICWIGACLADGLQYAHDRGLLHLDVKPSNVLIAADGLPLLLDFHLAKPPIAVGGPSPSWIGGTIGYSAPEQMDAIEALRTGRPIPRSVNARADVYALGVLLKSLLHSSDGAG